MDDLDQFDMDDFDESEDEAEDINMKDLEGMAAQNEEQQQITDVSSDIDTADPGRTSERG